MIFVCFSFELLWISSYRRDLRTRNNHLTRGDNRKDANLSTALRHHVIFGKISQECDPACFYKEKKGKHARTQCTKESKKLNNFVSLVDVLGIETKF